MTIAKCAFCGKEQEDYKGTYLMKNDGSVLYFSSSKCLKNYLKLKRDKRKVRWAEAFHLTREKRKVKEKERLEKEAEKVKEKAKEIKERSWKTQEKTGKRELKKLEKKEEKIKTSDNKNFGKKTK